MSRVIDLSTFTRRKSQGDNLTELLKMATILRGKREEIKETIAVMNFAELKRVFEIRLADIILTGKNIGVEFFLCGTYVAGLLTDIANAPPESWYAVDYFIKAATEDKPTALKEGANVCFLICSVFPKRGQIRCMRPADYEAMGRNMYYGYYGQTGAVVAYHMSQRFKPMAEITKECIKELE